MGLSLNIGIEAIVPNHLHYVALRMVPELEM